MFRLHLQKYLSENSSKFASQITQVLKPATALSVGAAAASTIVALATIAVLTFFTMLEAPRMWRGFLGLFQQTTADRLGRVVDETISSVTGYMLGNFLTSVIAGVVVFVSLTILGVPSPGSWASSWPWSTCCPWSEGCWPACRRSSSPPFTRCRRGSSCW